ncbi:hypothetical protein H8D91_01020 [archaeon]|nr:hypothetical protein [archaeon]
MAIPVDLDQEQEVLLEIKMGKLFLVLLMGMFLVSFASATVDVTYSVYEAVFEDDGSFNESNVPINNFEVEGYVCLDTNCQTLGQEIPGLNPVYSGNNVKIYFPTNNMTDYGYTLYFHNENYIGWEQWNIAAWGTGSYTNPNRIYLSQKRTGYAPIQNMVVANEVHPGMPLEIDFEVSIDAETYAAIKDNTQSGLDHGETLETEVKLEIFDSLDNLIYEDTTSLDILYSGSEEVSFEYVFNPLGNYEIRLTTNITDEKVINSLLQIASANVRVIEQEKTNYSYTILNGLIMNPLIPKTNETVSFSIDYLSKFVDGFGAISDVGTDLEVVYTFNGLENDSSEIYLASDGTYYFDYVFPESGLWEVSVSGSPNPALGEDIVVDSRSLIFFVYDNLNNQTNVTSDYFASLNNLIYPTGSLEEGDNYGFSFDYIFYELSSSGNITSMNGTLSLEILLDNSSVESLDYNLSGNSSFEYNFDLDEGDYGVNLVLCPSIDSVLVGHCRYETWMFSVSEGGNDDDDEDDKYKNNEKIDLGPSIFLQNETVDYLVLNEKKNEFSLWALFLFLLLLCVIVLFFIVLVLLMRNKNKR